MKTFKKIVLGLTLAFAFLGLFSILVPGKAEAATRADADRCRDTLRFTDYAHLTCTTSQGPVTFFDNNPTDSDEHFAWDGRVFCNVSDMGVHIRFSYSEPPLVRDANSAIPVKLVVGFSPASNPTACDKYDESFDIPPGNRTVRLMYLLRFQGNQALKLEGIAHGELNQNSNFSLVQGYSPSGGGLTTIVLANGNYTNCSGSLIIVQSSGGPDSGIAKHYSIRRDNGGIDRGRFPDAFNFYNWLNVSGCGVDWGGLNDGRPAANNEQFAVLGIPPTTQDTPPGGGTTPPPPGNVQPTCEATWTNPLTWIVCPIFNIAEAATNELIDEFEKQACFKVEASPTASNTKCTPTPVDDIKPAWNAIKNIVSALLIVIMLVAIFAQAVSVGPIDAYTLRKMLPRLVAAVILIQVSFYLFSWIINLGDDVGEGLKGVLTSMFPGELNNLNWLLGKAGVGTATVGIVHWLVVVPALAIAALIALPLVLLGLFTAVVALLIAFATLIFRKIFLIALLLISPIALLLWVLPNTERYWKMWQDNFIKLLLMFPLIVLIVEAGRIFAYVAGSTTGGGLVGFLIVMIAFFGPLFILPKTYKWGGALMSVVGDRAFKASDRYLTGEKAGANKYLRNRQQDWQEQRRRASMHRVATGQGLSRDPKSWYRTPLDRFRSGKWDPLKQAPGYRDVARRSVEGYVQAGEELHQKDVEAARQKVLREGQRHRARGRNWDQYFQQVADSKGDGSESYIDSETKERIEIGKRSDLEKQAAMKQTAILGAATNWRYLEGKYQQMKNMGNKDHADYNPENAAELRKFFDDNVDTIMPKMPHVYVGANAAADSKATNIGQMHGVGVEAILSNLSATIKKGSAAGAEADDVRKGQEAQRSLATFIQNFGEAAENENIQVETGALRAVKAFLDSDEGANLRTEINYASRDPDNPGRDGRSPRNLPELGTADELSVAPNVRAVLDNVKNTVAVKIDNETGTYAPSVAATGGTGGAEGVLRVVHEDNLQTPGATGVAGVTPLNEAYVQNELVSLRRRVARGETLNADEQRRLEQIRTTFPHL